MKLIIEVDEKRFEEIKQIANAQFELKNKTEAQIIANGKPYDDSGDLISREALKKAIKDNGYSHYFEIFDIIDNAQAIPLPNEQIAWEQGYEAGLAQGKHNKPQVTVFAENADEKAVSDLKAELQNVIEARPKGKWEMIRPYKYKCDICGCETSEEDGLSNFCPDCGADMRGGAE